MKNFKNKLTIVQTSLLCRVSRFSSSLVKFPFKFQPFLILLFVPNKTITFKNTFTALTCIVNKNCNKSAKTWNNSAKDWIKLYITSKCLCSLSCQSFDCPEWLIQCLWESTDAWQWNVDKSYQFLMKNRASSSRGRFAPVWGTVHGVTGWLAILYLTHGIQLRYSLRIPGPNLNGLSYQLNNMHKQLKYYIQ